MIRRLPFLILAGIIAELASILWIGNFLGVGVTLLLLMAGGLLGVSLIKSAGTGIAEALRSPVQASSLQRGAAGKAVARVLSGVFFLIPGFFSDVFGLLLLLPPVRQWLRSKIKVEQFSTSNRPPPRYDTTIDAEVIEITGEIDPPDPVNRSNGTTGQDR